LVSVERCRDMLLRAVVDALEQVGYAVIARRNNEGSNAVLLFREAPDAGEDTSGYLLVSHEPSKRRLSAALYRGKSLAPGSQSDRRLRHYYSTMEAEKRLSKADELAATVSAWHEQEASK
jgi:hypothetical protein